MRNRFVSTLLELAQKDKNIYLITGDLGYNVITPFQDNYHDRYINAGISEQNMTGVAAGIAMTGKTVFTYSIANFPSLRCLEQIRNDVAYHKANVKIVSVGAGLGYGQLGMSHHATEDAAVLRALPELVVCSPGDPVETMLVTNLIYEYQGPCYLKLGKGKEKEYISPEAKLSFGKSIKLAEGNSVALLSTGPILEEAVNAYEELNRLGISTGLYSFPFIKPVDDKTIIEISNKYDLIVTIEEHNIIGGLSSAVSEVMARLKNRKAHQIPIGLKDEYPSVVGSQRYLRKVYGIDSDAIVSRIIEELNAK